MGTHSSEIRTRNLPGLYRCINPQDLGVLNALSCLCKCPANGKKRRETICIPALVRPVVVPFGLFWVSFMPFLYSGVYYRPSKKSLFWVLKVAFSNSNTMFLRILHIHLLNCVLLFYLPLQNMTLFT